MLLISLPSVYVGILSCKGYLGIPQRGKQKLNSTQVHLHRRGAKTICWTMSNNLELIYIKKCQFCKMAASNSRWQGMLVCAQIAF
jgi:hypothetical protein